MLIDDVKLKIRKRTSYDFFALITLFVLSYLFFVLFDVINWLHQLSQEHHIGGVSELAPTIFMMAFGFAIFAYRRWQDTKQLSLYTEELSMTDPMTNLPNRRAINRMLNQLACNNEYPAGIILVDVEGLEGVRNQLGLSVAEHLLIELLYKLSNSLADNQLIAYWQAGQFVILCPGLEQPEVNQLSNKLKSISLDKESLIGSKITINCVGRSVTNKIELERVFNDLEEDLI